MKAQIPVDAKGVLFVVSTSHMDWHWHSTFEQYYTMGSQSDGHMPVRYILDQVRALLPTPNMVMSSTPPAPNTFYKYNLAEVAWLRRYLLDNPDWIKDLALMQGYFSFIGGGITSPDSLVTNGEVFIRTYLVGREYIRKKGLEQLLTNACWVPDDFGTDPQLPVVLQAMGLRSVSFARIPGWQPNSNYYAANPSDQNQSLQLAKNGVTFRWLAADGSSVLANYMLCVMQNPGYGYPWNQEGATADNLNTFITQNNYPSSGKPNGIGPTFPVNQPGLIMMTPSGGDFAVPSNDLLNAVQEYNEDYYPSSGSNYNGTGVYAIMGSFQDFVEYVLEKVNTKKLTLQTLQGWNAAENGFDPTSYWTGHFANYVQLKINQQRTTNRLMAAETLSTLLRAYSYLSDYLLDGLDNMIAGAWNDLVPSSHHDYITGTAPTSIYQQEQLPLSNQALKQAEASLNQGMELLAASVNASTGEKEVPYVVFNPAGTARTISKVVEIPATPALALLNSYRIDNDTEEKYYAIQRTTDNKILILLPDLESMGYTVVYFSPNAPTHPVLLIPQKPEDNGSIYLNNGVVQIAIDKGETNGWALNSILILNTQTEVANGLCNSLQAYSEDGYGNPYQMGNEISADGFQLAETPSYTIGKGNIMETGPYRWRFLGKMTNIPQQQEGESKVQMEYILEWNDPIIHMRVKGNAAYNTATSVVTSWGLNNTPTAPPAMCYGTANHWNGPNFTPYWPGPVFRSTHDFVTIEDTSNPSGAPLCAMYHEGVRAWTYSSGQLMGILFRNTNDNIGRGASNSDPDTHTQYYVFRIPGVGTPDSCQPLQESLQCQMPLVAAAIPSINAGIAEMAATGNLASITGNAILRMARTQPGSGGVQTNPTDLTKPMPFSFVLRLYQPTNTTSGSWTVNIPFINNNEGGTPVISKVTALEEPIFDALPVKYANGAINFDTLETLTTLQVQSWGPLILPSNP